MVKKKNYKNGQKLPERRPILPRKKDYLTSFGCITYAHGLLDAIRLTHDLIIEE